MTKLTTKPDAMQPATEMAVYLFDNWFDPIETEVRARARQFIEELIHGELDTALARPRYERSKVAGNQAEPGSRTRSLTGTFGPVEIAGPADYARRRDGGMEEPGAAGLSATHACRRRADRKQQ
jgi:putative transposase